LVGRVDVRGNLASLGTTCALCHSTVDNSFAPGIGKRLDGWPNRDLDVGAIVALSPALTSAQKEVGRDPAYAARSATGRYRTTPLRGLWHPPQLTGPYFHDGSAATLQAVVEHYVEEFDLSLTRRQQADLVEFLKSL
jgi:cytochrome c peroxidase